jgi:hypothetical protein
MVCGANDCGIESLQITDDQSHILTGYLGQVTHRGYDNMTGLGTPDGQKFVSALRRLEG